jgi:probable rRNA maturation factor
MTARRGLVVRVTDARGRAARHGRGLGSWLARIAPRTARGQVAIALVSDAEMRRLNRTHRGLDRVTDVLSFPSGDRPAGRTKSADFLGDLAIALGVARRQASDSGHSLATELRVLALHGLLHLLGYDHEADEGEMGRLEERLRRAAGLPSALIARSVPPARQQ